VRGEELKIKNSKFKIKVPPRPSLVGEEEGTIATASKL
jgi:hypothetical protein